MFALLWLGIFGLFFGGLSGNHAEITLGLIATGMAAVAYFFHAMRRDWRKNRELLHGRRRP